MPYKYITVYILYHVHILAKSLIIMYFLINLLGKSNLTAAFSLGYVLAVQKEVAGSKCTLSRNTLTPEVHILNSGSSLVRTYLNSESSYVRLNVLTLEFHIYILTHRKFVRTS